MIVSEVGVLLIHSADHQKTHRYVPVLTKFSVGGQVYIFLIKILEMIAVIEVTCTIFRLLQKNPCSAHFGEGF